MERAIGLISANYNTSAMEQLTGMQTIASIPFGAKFQMIDFSLSSMVNSGIISVGMVMPMKSRSLLEHIGTGKDWNLDRKVGGLSFLPEARKRKDQSAQSFLFQNLRMNEEFLLQKNEPYVVYGSSHLVCNIDYRPILNKMDETGADIILICSRLVRGRINCLAVDTDRDGHVITISDNLKGGALYIGSFIIRRELLLQMITQYNDENIITVIGLHLDTWNVQMYEHRGYVGNISSVYDYYLCNQDVLSEQVQQELFYSQNCILTKVHDNNPTRLCMDSNVKNSILNAGSEIHGTIENSIIFRGVKINAGAVIKNSILMPGVQIGANAKIEYAIIKKNVVINEKVSVHGKAESPLVIENDI